VESIEVLAESIHPELKGHFGHYGTDLLTTLPHAWEMAKQGQQTGSTKIRPSPFLQQQQQQQAMTTTTTTTPTTSPTATPTTKAVLTEGKNSVVNSGNNDQNYDNDTDIVLSPHQSPTEVVSRQLYCLESGRFEEAFALNSSANQSRWCSSDRFVSVLRSHPDFCKLLVTEKENDNNDTDNNNNSSSSSGTTTPTTKAIIIEERINEDDGGVAMVRVAVPESTMELTWTMVTEKRSSSSSNKQCGATTESVYWRTENVK